MKGWLTEQQIRSGIQTHLRHPELEFHLEQLRTNKLLRKKTEPYSIKMPSSYGKKPETIKGKSTTYQITEEGMLYVENGFIEQEQKKIIPVQYNIFGNAFFGEVNMFTINQILEKENIKEEIREEIKGYFEELEQELKGDVVNKPKVKVVLDKIGNVGIDELIKAGISLLIKQFTGA